MSVQLPHGWQESIAARALFILQNSRKKPKGENNWYERINEVTTCENGYYLAWLALTGCYPDKFEYRDFVTQTTIYGLQQSVQNVLANRARVPETARNLVAIELVSPKFNHLVDVTHTYSAPYLTGIQRVVFGVVTGPENISPYVWVGDSGIIQEKDMRRAETDGTDGTDETGKPFSEVHGRHLRLVHFLHAQVPKFDKTRSGTRLRISLLPFARKTKQYLIAKEVENQLKNTVDHRHTNVLVLNATITIPEIPASLRQISIYESILENEIAPVQVILYDFIPFFHAWTVHPGNRGHLNSYVRIVLLANRIVSISSLVQEQAKLITKAFRLERSDWSQRKQVFDYLDLPSGLKPADSGEFKKQKNLVVMAGSLEPRKNHMQFLSAIEFLSKEGVSVKAKILGSAGWENENILAKIHDLQSKGIDVERLGNLNDEGMRKLVAEAQVLLQISEAEGFGLPIAEALALGTKVIVSNVRPLNEWKSPRVSIVDIGDVEQLKNALDKILSKPEVNGKISPEKITWGDWHRLLYGKKSTL